MREVTAVKNVTSESLTVHYITILAGETRLIETLSLRENPRRFADVISHVRENELQAIDQDGVPITQVIEETFNQEINGEIVGQKTEIHRCDLILLNKYINTPIA